MKYYNISKEEMHEFLTARGFTQISLPNTLELVYAKIVNFNSHKLSLRIYTAINPTGESRIKGADAIRVQFFWMYKGSPVPVGNSQKCLRVEGWKKNLEQAIELRLDSENIKECPACSAPMVLRQSGDGTFWGCSTWKYTRCNGRSKTPNMTPRNEVAPPAIHRNEVESYKTTERSHAQIDSRLMTHKKNSYRIPENLISNHQIEVQRCFEEEKCNIVVGARAGSGKTTLLCHLASFRQQSVLYLAFGRKNASEGRKKMPSYVNSSTTHSFCIQWLKKYIEIPSQSSNLKNTSIMDEIYPSMSGNKNRRRIRKSIFHLIGLAKNYAVRPDDIELLKQVMAKYHFELESEEEANIVVEMTNEALHRSLPDKCGCVYEYNDLLWWPVVLELPPPQINEVLADECQDFNACQVEILKKMSNNGTRIIAVGDPFQAVFRFRGADNDSYYKIKSMLSATEAGCKELILPVNYRCGKNIIEMVRKNTIVDDIEAAPNAIEGSVVQDMSYNQILDMIVSEN